MHIFTNNKRKHVKKNYIALRHLLAPSDMQQNFYCHRPFYLQNVMVIEHM